MNSMHSYRPPKNRWSFSLIELLVVIAIICVLAALLFPAYSQVRKRAKMQRATVEAGHVAAAFRQYYADRGRWPFFNFGNWGFANGKSPWQDTIDAYIAAGLYGTNQMNQIMAGSNDIAVGHVLLGRLRGGESESAPHQYYQTFAMGPWLTPDPKSLQTTNSGSVTVTNLLDLFGNVYQARFDMTDCGAVLNPFDNATWIPGVSVIVWSAGPDRQWTSNSLNAAVNRDNIKSW